MGLRRPSIAFVAICLGYFAIILDGSVLNVAIPAIRADLHASLASAQWVLNAYTLTLAGLLLTAGALGDRVGLRRMFLFGAVVFTAASAACAAAPSVPVLIAARVVQGLGAAALLPATLALIPYLFADAARRGRATVVWVGIGAGAVALGPLIGGLLIDAFRWRSVFLINLPIGIISVLLGRVSITETPRRERAVDRVGQATAVVALVLITGAVIRGGEAGWGSPITVAMLIAGVMVGIAFAAWERRVAEPMLPPAFFADRLRTVAVVSAALMGFLFYGTLFLMSLYFQELRGWTPGSTGVALLPLTVGTLAGPFVIYRPLSRRFGHPRLLVAGFVCTRDWCCGARTDRCPHRVRTDRARPAADRSGEHGLVLGADLTAAGEHHRGTVRSRLRRAEHDAPGRRPDGGVDPRRRDQRGGVCVAIARCVRCARRRSAARDRRVVAGGYPGTRP